MLVDLCCQLPRHAPYNIVHLEDLLVFISSVVFSLGEIEIGRFVSVLKLVDFSLGEIEIASVLEIKMKKKIVSVSC